MFKYTCLGCKYLPKSEECKECGKYIITPDGEETVFIHDKWQSKENE